MDQFDKLIKEKAEKREFKYKPIFWLLFAKQAGFMAFSAIQIVSGILIVGGIITGSVLLTQVLVKKNNSSQLSRQREIQTIPTDTSLQTTPTIEYKTDTLIPEQTISVPIKKTHQKAKEETLHTKTQIKKDSEIIQKEKPINPYAGRRILTIDPDTILTND
ncbi:MAG: hypothetical protein CVU04_02220 [Bacteroidetes bacterium HGW-Bacteroidetes-20]|nr:MAG: hypothetical protein CVU04_02220 [Bacteroidetes bacterium HGW-Bacteroidetes-20]